MRSFDYCHFEVELASDQPLEVLEIDSMRKVCALLVDEAVRQYRIAKECEARRASKQFECQQFIAACERLKATVPQSQLTVEQAAMLRAYADRSFLRDFDQERYLYEDEEREMHFSMLNQFREAKVGQPSPLPAPAIAQSATPPVTEQV